MEAICKSHPPKADDFCDCRRERSSVGRASRCQRDCRRFEPGRSLHFLSKKKETSYFLHYMVSVAQLVRASDCGSEGRGFESHHSPQFDKNRVTHSTSRFSSLRRGLLAMDFQEINKILGDIYGMGSESGKILYDFVLNNDIQNILELGFAHGRSTCYMAAALSKKGVGSIKAMDLLNPKKVFKGIRFSSIGLRRGKPKIISLLEEAKFDSFVKPVFANSSYNWELMKLIEERTQNGSCEPLFDFCFIDGAHSWGVDGFAFFLVEKLLKPKGWLLFDDLHWTYESSPTLGKTKMVKQMPEDERKTSQVNKIFTLLVSQHPNFQNFKQEGEWGWAQKK